jgi:hypothetical protein
MIISEKYKFVFIEIPKTGTTSIRSKLSTYGLNEMQINDPEISRHTAAWAAERSLGKMGLKWDEMFKFAFVRNPWDRCISTYHNAITTDYDNESIPLDVRNWRRSVRDAGNFESYALGLMTGQSLQSDYVYDRRRRSRYLWQHKKLKVDFIGHYETLQDDFDKICKRLGLPQSNLEQLNASHDPDTGSPKKHYATYYNELTKALVKKKYKQDIDVFGYTY